MIPRRRGQGGQATVELALALPLLVLLALGVVQVGLVGRDAIAVSHAARAAARAVIIDGGAAEAASRAAPGLNPQRLTVQVSGDRTSGGIVTVTVLYRDPTDVPLVGRLLGDVQLSEQLSAMVE